MKYRMFHLRGNEEKQSYIKQEKKFALLFTSIGFMERKGSISYFHQMMYCNLNALSTFETHS